MDNSKLKEVVENTKSIRKLKHYVEKITINKPTEESPLKMVEYYTSPPPSLLFAFNLDSQDPKIWKKRFTSTGFEDLPMCSILLEISAILEFSYFDSRNKDTFRAMYCNLREGEITPEGDFFKSCASDKPNQLLFNEQVTYKTALFQEQDVYPYLMPERALLFFLLGLNEMIEATPKHLTFNISFVEFLRNNGYDARMDKLESQKHTAINLSKMMHDGIYNSDKVILILTEKYKIKADRLEGGVGEEIKIIQDEIARIENKYILVSFTPLDSNVISRIIPSALAGREVVDLKRDQDQNNFNILFSKLSSEPILIFSNVANGEPVIKKQDIPKFEL